ncbi:MAG: polyhydroxyalkanoate depolymerase [Caulobacter segnis]|uniref:Polyhydroxyalkanoate depolymerase n=1 Tax=Caulobacter segnis TaxID=88688 RepID=A0A2W5V7M7_9CAUL|nr:MAG: polyhydroxyalkanoate depolymerase [Caulobacter segnis]
MREKITTWAGWMLSGAFSLFIAGASVAPKLLHLPAATQTLEKLGWNPRHTLMIGIIEATCLVLYLIPRTRLLGAVLFTGLLGGAMATQIRAGSPLFSHVLFSLYLGLFLWGGLWLRDPTLRAVFPFSPPSPLAGEGVREADG